VSYDDQGTEKGNDLGKLTDLSVVSCIPSYWHSTGPPTVSLNGASPLTPNYIDFTGRTSTAMQLAFSDSFESVLHEYTIFNAAAATNTDALGFSILSAANTAANKDAKAAMAPDAIQNVTERVFSALYAALATSESLTPAESATGGSGVLVEPVNWLFVARLRTRSWRCWCWCWRATWHCGYMRCDTGVCWARSRWGCWGMRCCWSGVVGDRRKGES
jgi:hypothetical protein